MVEFYQEDLVDPSRFQVTRIGFFLAKVFSSRISKNKEGYHWIGTKIANTRGLDRQNSNDWWEKFCKSNPSISYSVGPSFSITSYRAKATDLDILENYFDFL